MQKNYLNIGTIILCIFTCIAAIGYIISAIFNLNSTIITGVFPIPLIVCVFIDLWFLAIYLIAQRKTDKEKVYTFICQGIALFSTIIMFITCIILYSDVWTADKTLNITGVTLICCCVLILSIISFSLLVIRKQKKSLLI